MLSTTGDKPGEGLPSGGLTDRMVPQIEAPTDLIAYIGKRTVDGVAVENDSVTALDGQGESLFHVEELLGNLVRTSHGGAIAVIPRAVGEQFFLVATGNDLKRPLLHSRVVQREPYRDHLRVIGFIDNDAVILMPWGSPQNRVPEFVLREDGFRRLDANMLDGIGIDLRADERLDRVQQALAGKEIEHGLAGPEGSVRPYVLERQRKVEVLLVDIAGCLAELDVALTEFQTFEAVRDFTLVVKVVDQPVQDSFILLNSRVENRGSSTFSVVHCGGDVEFTDGEVEHGD